MFSIMSQSTSTSLDTKTDAGATGSVINLNYTNSGNKLLQVSASNFRREI